MKEKLKFLICMDFIQEEKDPIVIQVVYKKLLQFYNQYDLQLILMSCAYENQQQLFLTPSNQVKRENYEIVDDFLDTQIEIIKSWEGSNLMQIEKFTGDKGYYESILQCIQENKGVNCLYFNFNTDNIDKNDHFMDIISKLYKKFIFPIVIIPDNLTERKLNFLL